jgi:hypothetical protein
MLPGATVPRSLADLLAVFRALLYRTDILYLRRAACWSDRADSPSNGVWNAHRRGVDQVWHHSRAQRLFRELAELIAACYPDRIMHVVGDAAYVGERLRDVDSRITWTSRLKVTSVLHELPLPRSGGSGRPRTRGVRLGTPADLAALARTTNTWRSTQVRRDGRTDRADHRTGLSLVGSFRSRTVRVILVCQTPDSGR